MPRVALPRDGPRASALRLGALGGAAAAALGGRAAAAAAAAARRLKGPRRAEQGAANMSDTKVKVAVRVRPMNRRGERLSPAPFAFLLRPRAGVGECNFANCWAAGVGDTGVARRGPGWRRRPGSGRGHYVPGAPSPCLPGRSHASRLRSPMIHFATSPCPCAFRAGTEHQVRGGDGREPDGPAPSSFQHQAGRKVNPTPPAPAKFEPGKPECALPLLARVASSLSHAHMRSGCKCRVPSSLCVPLFVSLSSCPLSSRAVSPRQGTLARVSTPDFQDPRT